MRIRPCVLASCLPALHARACSPTKMVSRHLYSAAVTIASHNGQFEVPTTHPTCTSSYADCYSTLALVLSHFIVWTPPTVLRERGNRKPPWLHPWPHSHKIERLILWHELQPQSLLCVLGLRRVTGQPLDRSIFEQLAITFHIHFYYHLIFLPCLWFFLSSLYVVGLNYISHVHSLINLTVYLQTGLFRCFNWVLLLYKQKYTNTVANGV